MFFSVHNTKRFDRTDKCGVLEARQEIASKDIQETLDNLVLQRARVCQRFMDFTIWFESALGWCFTCLGCRDASLSKIINPYLPNISKYCVYVIYRREARFRWNQFRVPCD